MRRPDQHIWKCLCGRVRSGTYSCPCGRHLFQNSDTMEVPVIMNPFTSLLALLGAGWLLRRKVPPEIKPPTPVTPPMPSDSIRELMIAHAGTYGLDWKILEAIGRVESGLNPNAVSPPNRNQTRDYGIMQINESTAKTFGVPKSSLMSPEVNISLAAKLLKSLKQEWVNAEGRQPTQAELIAAYNAGGPAIRRRGIFNQAYVTKVEKELSRLV